MLEWFWSRYHSCPSFYSISSFLSRFTDCHTNTSQCVFLVPLIPFGRAVGSRGVMRIESVPHLRSCWGSSSCLVLWAQPAAWPLTPPAQDKLCVNPVLCYPVLLTQKEICAASSSKVLVNLFRKKVRIKYWVECSDQNSDSVLRHTSEFHPTCHFHLVMAGTLHISTLF